MHYGYTGKILRIDLTRGTCTYDAIDPDILKKYLGGRGLGIWLLSQESRIDIDPFSEESTVIFCTGPYTGAGSFSAFYNVTFNSPLTGVAGSAHSGGKWGPYLKKAGYDALIITGKARVPSYIQITDGSCQILEAVDIWGKGVKETDRLLKDRHGKVVVAAIGPAGEKLNRNAAMMNDVHRAVGRGGLGAIMGSKNIKAIVVGGAEKIQYYNRKAFMEISKNAAKQSLAVAAKFASYGTTYVIGVMNEKAALPTHNFRSGQFRDIDKITGETMKSLYWVRDQGCYNCPLRCANIHCVPDGPFAVEETEGPEYETMMAFGPNCGNSNLECIIKANDMCNDLGMDTIATGQTIALLFDLYERGFVDANFAPGMDLSWGNPETIIKLIELMGNREGCGEILAEGAFRTAEYFGSEAQRYAIHAKKQEFPGYEVRRANGVGLSFATSNRGACHLRASMYVDEIFTGEIDPYGLGDEKIQLMVEKENLLALIDSLSMCKFGQRNGGFTLEVISETLFHLTGMDFSVEDLKKIGERVYNLERQYIFPASLPSGEKFDRLPDRLFEEDLDDGQDGGGRLSREEFAKGLSRYYEFRQWTETGKPQTAKLSELGIQTETST